MKVVAIFSLITNKKKNVYDLASFSPVITILYRTIQSTNNTATCIFKNVIWSFFLIHFQKASGESSGSLQDIRIDNKSQQNKNTNASLSRDITSVSSEVIDQPSCSI